MTSAVPVAARPVASCTATLLSRAFRSSMNTAPSATPAEVHETLIARPVAATNCPTGARKVKPAADDTRKKPLSTGVTFICDGRIRMLKVDCAAKESASAGIAKHGTHTVMLPAVNDTEVDNTLTNPEATLYISTRALGEERASLLTTVHVAVKLLSPSTTSFGAGKVIWTEGVGADTVNSGLVVRIEGYWFIT